MAAPLAAKAQAVSCFASSGSKSLPSCWPRRATVPGRAINAMSNNRLALMASDGSGERRILAPDLDRGVGSPTFTADGSALLFSIGDSGENHIGHIDLVTEAVTRPVSGEIAARGFTVSPDGKIATSVSSFYMPVRSS